MMGSFRRPRFMSSPVLSDLARFHASSPALQLSNASIWNRANQGYADCAQTMQEKVLLFCPLHIHVETGLPLPFSEEVVASEDGIGLLHYRVLSGDLWTQTDSMTSPEDQLLSKGLAHILEKLLLHEDENCLKALSEIWVTFFTETLPTLQAIFYPVQGQELTVRQMALLGFRDHVLLKIPLEDMLHATAFPSAIIQMLLILQGIHEPSGPSKEYYLLEKLVDMVISPYLSNYLYISHRKSSSECCLENPKSSAAACLGQPEITITHIAAESLLTPLIEQDGEAYLERTSGIRRHTVANVHSDIQLLSINSRTNDTGRGKLTKVKRNASTSPFSSQLVKVDPRTQGCQSTAEIY